jgi:iron complex transport system substrate-binding protein
MVPIRIATRRCMHAIATLLVAIAAAACGDTAGGASPGATPVSAVDDAGREVTLAAPARRVVSLVPSYTDALVAMGAADRLVARTDYDHHAEIARLPSVGGGLDPSLEVLAGLRPDLVIAWQERSPRLTRRLGEMGIAVFTVQTQDTTDALRGIEEMGTLLGEEAAAAALLADLRGRFAAVRASVADRPRRSVLYLVGIDPPRTAGSETFPLQLVGLAGGETVFADVSGWPQVSLEAVVRRDPDVILLPTGEHDARLAERIREMPGWRDLRAVREGRVRPLPVDTVNRPGPAMGRSAELLRDAIHPGAGGG